MEEKIDESGVVATLSEDAETGRQEQQAELVRQGENLPGVAEAIAAYRKFAPRVPAATVAAQPVSYSNGGNT